MKIEYNIKSYGTENQGNVDGYMAVTEIVNSKRFILPIPHYQCVCDNFYGALTINKQLSIYKIAVARFGLITQLFLEKHKFYKNSKILVVGVGCVGFACLQMLLLNNYKNLFLIDNKTINIEGVIQVGKGNCNYEDYDVIIEATGKFDVLNCIMLNCKPMATIVLLGTCRQEGGLKPAVIHRKNLTVLGAHELVGYTNEYRQKIFSKVVNMIYDSPIEYNDRVELVDKEYMNSHVRNAIYTIYKNNA